MNKHPRGKIRDDDEGVHQVAIFNRGNTVIVDFLGKRLSWLGFDISTAQALGIALLTKVDELKASIKKGKIKDSEVHAE